MNSEFVIYNIFELPDDILSMIYFYLKIEYIETLCSISNNYKFLTQSYFW